MQDKNLLYAKARSFMAENNIPFYIDEEEHPHDIDDLLFKARVALGQSPGDQEMFFKTLNICLDIEDALDMPFDEYLKKVGLETFIPIGVISDDY